MLLTAEVPGNELMSVLGRKVAQITKASFDVRVLATNVMNDVLA